MLFICLATFLSFQKNLGLLHISPTVFGASVKQEYIVFEL